MRGIIIKSISVEDIQAVRHLQAVEGYLDLGLFQQAKEELQQLDRSWFNLQPVMQLRSRVYAALKQSKILH